MKVRVLISAACFLLLGSCQKDGSKPTPQSFTAKIGGEIVEFSDAKVFIKRENGFPFSQEIKGQVVTDTSILKELNFRYVGELNTANTDSTFTVLMGVYYKNDYSESWSNISGPGGISLTSAPSFSGKASGSLSDFMAINGTDTLLISEIAFENIPIRYADF